MREYNFSSVKFMRKEEKEKVLKDWKSFIKSGFSYETFTKRIYKHLTLHCMFIAHYSKDGFYSTYFINPEDTLKFLRQFDKNFEFKSIEYGINIWIKGEYKDINLAMCEQIEKCKKDLYKRLNLKIRTNALREIKNLCQRYAINPKEIKIRQKELEKQKLKGK